MQRGDTRKSGPTSLPETDPVDEQVEGGDLGGDTKSPENDEFNRDLPDELQIQLKALCKKFSGRELKDRRWEIRRARKARFFWRGIQHILWNDDSQTMVVGQLGGVGGWPGTPGSDDKPTFTRDYNIYTPYGKAFMSTFCQNQPATRFEPMDPRESMDIKSAAMSNKLKRVIEKFNPPKQLQTEFGRLFWTDDRVVTWTHWVEDGDRFGYEQKDGKKVARGQEVIDVFGVLEHKCPITIKDPADFVYQQISQEYDTSTVKARYPHIKDKIQEGSQGTMDDTFARNARIATSEGTTMLSEGGDALAHLTTVDYFFLKPEAFEDADEEYRDELARIFPDGCAPVFIGDVYAQARNVAMNAELRVFHATAGDGQNRNGLGDWLVPCQETFNNDMNMAQEYFEYGIPEELHDQRITDIDGQTDRKASPGGIQGIINPDKNRPLDDYFHQRPIAEPSEQMMLFMQWLQGPFAQFITAQQPAAFGQSDKHNETKGGLELLRDQALGLVGLVWMPFTIGWAEVIHQAVKISANKRQGKASFLVPVQGPSSRTEPIDIDFDDLKGEILSSPETDENFPESWTQKSNKIVTLFTDAEKNPAFAPIAALPRNMQLFKQATGLDDLEIPGQASYDKQMEEIQELLKTGPDLNQQAPGAQEWLASNRQTLANGGSSLPIPKQIGIPTIPIDPDFDDSSAEWLAGVAWVNDLDAGQAAKKNNPQGFLNVCLHLLQHKAVNDQKAQQAMQQQLALKHPDVAKQQDPGAEAAKQLLLKDAADAVQGLDAIGHIAPSMTGGTVTGQVAAFKTVLESAVKASTQ